MSKKWSYIYQFIALFMMITFAALAGESYKAEKGWFIITMDIFCTLLWFFNFHIMWYYRYRRYKPD